MEAAVSLTACLPLAQIPPFNDVANLYIFFIVPRETLLTSDATGGKVLITGDAHCYMALNFALLYAN